MWWPRACRLPILVGSLVFVVVACGSGSDSTGSDRPPGRATSTIATVFKDLPHYPRSHAVSSITTNADGTLAQSFTVNGATPQTILAFFVDTLPRQGWIPAGRPVAEGTTDRRGVWKQNRRSLVVSSAPAPSAGSTGQRGDLATAQYSFVLTPAGGAAP
jgi:hypothetical protein